MKGAFNLIIIAVLISSCYDGDQHIIGEWVDRAQFGDVKMTIYRKDNTYFLESSLSGSIHSINELNRREIRDQTRYFDTESDGIRDYYVMDDHGNLEVHIKQKLLRTLKKG